MTEKKARKRRTTRLLSLFLAAAISAAAQSFPSYAGTVRSNDTNHTSSNAAAPAGNSLPANPNHHCTTGNWEKDTTTWSYIYFGSYPQSEVTDSATITAIDKAIANGKGFKNTGIDVMVKGTKYRRISGNGYAFGSFDSNGNGYRYFKWEPIKWKVLNNNDNGTLFVVADCALDCAEYCNTDEKSPFSTITWENSDIRTWLNGSFYQTAFSAEEQNTISNWNVVNEDYPDCGVKGGNNTTDKVYLLSVSDMTDERYGFCGLDVKSQSRQIQPSAYAYINGVNRNNGDAVGKSLGCCTWWLRTSGYRANGNSCAANVEENGIIWQYDYGTWEGYLGVVPALHIDPSSDLWSPAKAENTTGKKALSIAIAAPSQELAAGQSISLKLNFTPKNTANKKVTWVINNPKYATIDKKNRLTLKKAGAGKDVTITAIAADGSGSYGNCLIFIMKHAVKSIKLSAPSKSVKAGSSIQLKATVKATGKNANKNLEWTSSNKKYATVTDSGEVTAKKAGKNKTVTITAKATDGTNKKAKIKLKIK